jgi:hypothetical protein
MVLRPTALPPKLNNMNNKDIFVGDVGAVYYNMMYCNQKTDEFCGFALSELNSEELNRHG